MKTEERLARAALALRAASPPAYEEFLRAMDQVRMEADDRVIEAPAESLQLLQGKARQVRALLLSLMNARSLVDKIDQAQRAKQ